MKSNQISYIEKHHGVCVCVYTGGEEFSKNENETKPKKYATHFFYSLKIVSYLLVDILKIKTGI